MPSNLDSPLHAAPIIVTGNGNTVDAASATGITVRQHALLSVFCALVGKHGRDALASDAYRLTEDIIPYLRNSKG